MEWSISQGFHLVMLNLRYLQDFRGEVSSERLDIQLAQGEIKPRGRDLVSFYVDVFRLMELNYI